MHLMPGESANVTLLLEPRAFMVWDESAHAWALATGQFALTVGESSRDMRLRGELQVAA